MRAPALLSLLSAVTFAARVFLNEPDTGLLEVFGNVSRNSLPNLSAIASLPDFDWAARNYLPLENYTYYRNAAGGEWTYRNNLEVFQRYTFKPRVLRDVTGVPGSLRTSILGFNFTAPFFISPCARGNFGHPGAELNLVRAADNEGILYMPSSEASLSMEEIASSKSADQVIFQQLYLDSNATKARGRLRQTEKSGAKAVVLTIDAPANGDRQRAYRLRGRAPEPDFESLTWEYYSELQEMTQLPIILKGIMSVEDAKMAVQHGAPAIILSNHGGRQLDGSPSALEVALDIHNEAPEIYQQIEVYADGGVRYGTDVLKLLSLGVKAVGLGRPFMYANVFGVEGVTHAIRILKRQIAVDAANLGVTDLRKLDASYVRWTPNMWMG